MKPVKNEIVVQHNVALSRFETEVSGHLSIAEYDLRGDQMVMTHTFVPPELRGQGIAEKLVRAALEHARSRHWRVVPACSYVATFIQRHAEFQPLVP